jgi:hypothetical protein
MTTPNNRQATRVTVSRILLVVGAVCFFLAAITTAGADIFSATAWAWGFGGFSAWMLSGAV